MKNIEAICSELGIEIPEDKVEEFKKQVSENYKTVADYDKQKEKIDTLSGELKSTKEKLDGLAGVDADGLKKEIETLKTSIAEKETEIKKKDDEYAAQLADRDFMDSIEKSIRAKNGKNSKAIMALMDMDALRASKNQQQDIDSALDALAKEEDSKMLFGSAESLGNGNPIGSVQNGGNGNTLTMNSAIADFYK